MHLLAEEIQARLIAIGKPEKARWLENYVKHDIQSRGVGIPDIRSIVKDLVKQHSLMQASLDDQKTLLDDLVQQAYSEDKLAAILYLQLYGKEWEPEQVLALIASWFDHEWITDWNVCDWLCVRILSPLLDKHPDVALPAFREWNDSPNLWKARASLVPFAECKTLAEHKKPVWAFSKVLIQREERFCKTAVGWVMRQYSKIDEAAVREFLSEYEAWTTKEVVRNATKYLK